MSGCLDILVVDDERNLRTTLRAHFEARGHQVLLAEDVDRALALASEQRFDFAFVDLRLGGESGLELIPQLLQRQPQLHVVVMTAYASMQTAIEAMKRGARDYLAKPFDPSELDLLIGRLQVVDRVSRRARALDQAVAGADDPLASTAASMQDVIATARRVAGSDARVLLRGESGTGKGVVARAIHALSARREGPFVVVPCPALPAELLESELFGHARGAFTGAAHASGGRVALAEGGTLLLDEIGDLPVSLQPKLLRFVQELEYERVGDPRPRRADVRLMATTNRDLEQAVAAGHFREDLFYRLAVVTLRLPPLRQRREDLDRLADAFLLRHAAHIGRSGLALSAPARAALRAHDWPGNVRELENAIERAVMLALGPEITPADLGLTRDLGEEPGQQAAVGAPVSLAALEEAHIRAVIERAGSLREAAEILGIDESTLWRRRKEYGI